MVICPHCSKKLDIDQLNKVMDYLAQNKMEGTTTFKANCCGQEIEAFSSLGMYYINTPSGPVLIGAA